MTADPTLDDITAGLADDLAAILDEPLTAPVESAHTVRGLFELLARREYATNDRVLHTLLSRLDDDPQARRLLLHAMRPALCSVALKHFHASALPMSTADAFCAVVDAFYDVLDRPHIRARTQRVAVRIVSQLSDELKRPSALDFHRSTDSWDNMVVLEGAMHSEQSHAPEMKTAHRSQLDLLEGLAWARDHEVITLEEARFLISVYSPETGLEETGNRAPASVRQRARRLAKRIAEAFMQDTDLLPELSSEAA